ncbi:unnamed protein product [Chondrus crispus]|uniref:Uncharacterized protein n=1 Tax=Chondrus crispus TaxID=2769 RepID=R7QKM0_CHOCR|nr:unnamed protein product [Chondrus crispus]CDF39057.1 unnamed protein product [Chondrus crispus]|eukprot:XP_005718968.1 unnamed protein product [Chondrus crispus]
MFSLIYIFLQKKELSSYENKPLSGRVLTCPGLLCLPEFAGHLLIY